MSTTHAADTLAARYDEPWRAYHTRTHVAEMLSALRFLTGERLHPALELAAWAHDAVYDPRAHAGDNERASATLAERTLRGLGVADDIVAEVIDLTLATITHDPRAAATDPARAARAAAFLDADLWILAAPPARFAEYERQIRAEYAFVPDSQFSAARTAILAGFARRPRLYLSERAHRSWEPSARSNLARIGHHGADPQRASTSRSSNQPSA